MASAFEVHFEKAVSLIGVVVVVFVEVVWMTSALEKHSEDTVRVGEQVMLASFGMVKLI